jgi:hypothetical protein
MSRYFVSRRNIAVLKRGLHDRRTSPNQFLYLDVSEFTDGTGGQRARILLSDSANEA